MCNFVEILGFKSNYCFDNVETNANLKSVLI